MFTKYFSTENNCFVALIITGRNEVVAKVMFLHVSVILSTGGVSGEPPLGPGRPPRQGEPPRYQADTPPDQGEPPGTRENPPKDQEAPPGPGRTPPGPRRTPLPPGPGRPPRTRQPPPRRRLHHTVNERLVRILLECILVRLVNSTWDHS